MAIDFDAIRKKLGQLSGNNSKRRVMWRPPQDETTTIRIIGFTDNDGNPFKERYFYYNIGNNPGLLAPYQFGKPDPINELIQKFKSEGTKEGYEMAKKLYPKMKFPRIGIPLWLLPVVVFQDWLMGLFSGKRLLTRSAAKSFSKGDSKYSSKKAENELGITWKSYDDCIHDTVEAYK